MVSRVTHLAAKETDERKLGHIKLPPRAESIVRIPVTQDSPLVGITSKFVLQEGVILAASLRRVVGGYVVTGILNTNDTEVEMREPLVGLDEVDLVWDGNSTNEFETQDREREILTQLRVEHLNAEEKKLLMGTCSEYSDILFAR